jgi:hypothetical protein
MKVEGASRNQRIKGQFLWRRQQLLIHCGQALTFEAPIALAFNGIPVVSLARDEANNLAVSVNMLTTSVLPPNGDEIRIEFKTMNDPDELATAVPGIAGVRDWATDLMKDSGLDSRNSPFQPLWWTSPLNYLM